MILLVYLLSVSFNTPASCDSSPQCNAWSSLEQALKIEDREIMCHIFSNCTGMSCYGNFHKYIFHASIAINQCETPVSIEVTADVPDLGIISWSRKFSHGDNVNLSEDIQGEFEVQKEKDKFTVGLNIIVMVSGSKYLSHLLKAPFKFNVFHDIIIPVPPCSDFKQESLTSSHTENISFSATTLIPLSTSSLILSPGNLLQDKRNCSIINSTCLPTEMCLQLHKLQPYGICVCIPHYVRDESGLCMFNPSSETSSEVPPNHTEPSHEAAPSNTSLLLSAILVPITVILLMVGIAYATIRFRVCQYLRRRLRVQVYEHVQLGQDDENDEQLANPIA